MSGEFAGLTRVYTYHGAVAHLRRDDRRAALCGRLPVWHSDWYGTGSQAEYERAAALPLCAYCAGKARERFAPLVVPPPPADA